MLSNVGYGCTDGLGMVVIEMYMCVNCIGRLICIYGQSIK